MKAGRELDALVAERVMGWRVKGFAPGHGLRPLPPDSVTCLTAHTIPRFSTDIAAAWKVVERVATGYVLFRLGKEIYSGVCQSEDFFATFDFPHYGADKPQRKVTATSRESIPHAICIAALKAVGG